VEKSASMAKAPADSARLHALAEILMHPAVWSHLNAGGAPLGCLRAGLYALASKTISETTSALAS